jgi:hypothetical protein
MQYLGWTNGTINSWASIPFAQRVDAYRTCEVSAGLYEKQAPTSTSNRICESLLVDTDREKVRDLKETERIQGHAGQR